MAAIAQLSAAGRVFDRVNRTAYLLGFSQLERRVPWWPAERLERLQSRRVRTTIEFAYAQVPFYRRTLRERGLTPIDFVSARDLEKLPIIDGSMLGANPDDFTAEQYRHAGREVFNTSGSTTGIRKRICWDHASLMRRFARGERDRVVIARLAEESWTASMMREFITSERVRTLAARLLLLESTAHQRLQILPSGFSSRTMRTIGGERSLIPRRPLHYHYLSPTAPFAVVAAQIRAIKPRVVYSFGSYIEHFVRYLADSGDHVPMPKVWVYLSDMVSEAGRELAEQLGCRLYSVYSAMETGTIGFQCERRESFHLNADLCALRIVGPDGRTLGPDQSGDIVVSALDNQGTVLLNYQIGDRGVLSEQPCPCGRTGSLLARLEGRRSEMIHLPDGRTLSSLVFEGLFRAELRRTLQAQVEQLESGKLLWHIVPFSSADREDLRRAFAIRATQVFGATTSVTVQFTEKIAMTDEGKFLRVVGKR